MLRQILFDFLYILLPQFQIPRRKRVIIFTVFFHKEVNIIIEMTIHTLLDSTFGHQKFVESFMERYLTLLLMLKRSTEIAKDMSIHFFLLKVKIKKQLLLSVHRKKRCRLKVQELLLMRKYHNLNLLSRTLPVTPPTSPQ